MLGTRQAGLPRFRVADLRRDGRWMERARDDALELCETLDETQLTALLARLEWRAPEGVA